MRVVFSPSARQDLTGIADYIARDNPRRALSFIREIRARCAKLAAAPRSARPFPSLGADARILPHGSYLILYRITDEAVSIERVLHGSRDVAALLAPDDDDPE